MSRAPEEGRLPPEQWRQVKQQRLDNLRQELEAKSSSAIRIQTLLELGLQFHEKIWNDDEEFWDWVKKHPERFRARYASFSMFFSKFATPRLQEAPDPNAGRRMTPDRLQALELSPEQIKKLAELDGESGDRSDDSQ
jgi:hypothetical protein